MENIEVTFIHPEARESVIRAYHRLKAKHPHSNGISLWIFARDYAFAEAVADTLLFKEQYFNK